MILAGREISDGLEEGGRPLDWRMDWAGPHSSLVRDRMGGEYRSGGGRGWG